MIPLHKVMTPKVVALAGGVGGARLADGLAQVLSPGSLTVIVNVGDDFDHFGLKICPDLDTVCYTLAGMENPNAGWGMAGESWNALESLRKLSAETWFRIGDRDLATHLERTYRLKNGQALSQVTGAFCQAWGIPSTVLPVTDHSVPTIVYSDEGMLAFQEYFVHRQCRPKVSGFRFEGAPQAVPAPGVQEALLQADLVVICPSNPWVSVDPILAIPGIRQGIEEQRLKADLPVIAVSPIIGGQTIKGPAAKMYQEMGMASSALTVARHYGTLLSGFVMDQQDADAERAVQGLGLETFVTDTIMRNREGRKRFAGEILNWLRGKK